jgi:hypothetical protein
MLATDPSTIAASLIENKEFILKLRQEVFRPIEKNEILGKLVDEIREVISELIHYQLEHELRELIEDNNRILKEIQSSMMKREPGPSLQEVTEEMSFSEVHKLMSEERHRIQDQINDASLDKSISAFVELKVETIE